MMSNQGNVPSDDGPPPLRLTGSPASPACTGVGDSNRLVHELANLLDGSLRNVGLALRRVEQANGEADPDVLERLRTSELALKQMAALINGWRVGQGMTRLAGHGDDLTLERIIDHAVGVMKPVADAQDIRLATEIDPAVADLCLPVLQPVLLNALRNAVEAIERDGEVVLMAERCGGDVELRISDDGPGVEPALSRDRDGLVPPGVSTKIAGQGLGLAISRDLVRAMGGTIRLEDNDRADRGAMLVVRLPIATASERA